MAFLWCGRRAVLLVLLLVAVTTVTYWPVLGNHFVNWDDQAEITENPDYNPAVTFDKLMWNWRHTRLTLYMPLTYMTWGAVAAVAPRDDRGALRPWPFHALNLALHAVCVIEVFALLRRLGAAETAAWLGAVAFAVHPIQVEAVAWASGMYTLLSAALSLGALLLYFTATDGAATDAGSPISARSRNRRRIFYALATALFAAALLTKAAAAATPLVAAGIDLLLRGRRVRDVIVALTPWALLAVPVVLLAKHFQDVSAVPAPPAWARPLVALDAIGFYLRKLAWPVGFAPDYGRNPRWVERHWPAVLVSAALAGVVLVALIAAGLRRLASGNTPARWTAVGAVTLVAGMAPYLGLTTFDFQYVSTVADRYAYLGLLGLALVVVAAASRSRAARVVVLAAAVVWASISWRQTWRWRDTESLFNHALAVNPDSLIGHSVLGLIARQQGRPAEAEARYRKALEVWPEDSTIHFDLGNLYLADHPDQAAREYELAVQYHPRMAAYRMNFGIALERTGRLREAFDQFREAAVLDPENAEPHVKLGFLLVAAGRIQDAKVEFTQALRLDPGNRWSRDALNELGAR